MREPYGQNRLYWDKIATVAAGWATLDLEDRMQRHEDEAEVARERAPGREDGRGSGRVEALRAAELAFARARLAPLSAEDASAIAALRDEGALRELVDTLAQASSVTEARAVLDAAIAGSDG